MLKKCIRLLLGLALVLPVLARADAVDLSQPLPEEPTIQYRTLPNGMRYWLRPNTGPSGKITLWLRVGSGSLNEDDDQRGLAHLLEHLAFNGSANFPAGTLVKRFEAAGLTFGAHQNATTSFIDTNYKLTIPNDPKVLDLSLLYFADVAYRLTLDPDEIKRESRVVQAERQARDDAASRAFHRQLETLAPGSRFIDRLPIGDPRIVREATAEQLRAYYKKWYRPDNTVLLVAGDVDAAQLDALVRKHFSAWPTVAQPSANQPSGIRPYERDRAHVVSEYGLISSDVNVAYLEPPRDLTSVRGYRAWLVQNLGRHLINTRLREQILEGKAAFASAWTAADSSFGTTLIEAHAKGAPEAWEAVLKGLLIELKRVREHGFGDAEFQHVRAAMLAELEKEALDEVDELAGYWITAMDAALDEGHRPFGARQRYELGKQLLATITRGEVEAAARARYAPERRTITLTTPKSVEAPSAAQLLKIVRSTEAMSVAKPEEHTWPQNLLAVDPTPGHTVQNTLNGELNVLSATLDNGVRLHIRPMVYRKDQVSVRVTIAGGRVNETPANIGITEAAALPFRVPATDQYSSVDIRRVMTTKQVSVTGRDTSAALELDVEGRRRDLEDGLRLANLLLTHGRIEPAVFHQWREQAMARQANREGSVLAQLNDRVDALLTGNDPRFRVLSPKEAERLTLDDTQAWLNGMLASAPIEVAIIGDITHEQALALAAKYFGSLPKRAPVGGALAGLRTLHVNPGPKEATVKVDTATGKGMVYIGWRGPDWQDERDWRLLDFASRILTNRLLNEVREHRGLAYSIRARASSNTPYRGNGRFRVSFVVDPLKADEAADIVEKIVADFVRTGPTAEELATAREQSLLSFRSGSTTPDFWLDVLSDLDYMGGDLRWVKSYLADVQSYTRDDVTAVLRKYVRNDRFIRVIGVPAELPAVKSEAGHNPVATIN
ncbi:MAG: M16 family metallopeptidase [Sulfurifustaceae bacterium]